MSPIQEKDTTGIERSTWCRYCDRETLEKKCPRCNEEAVCYLCGSCGTEDCGYVMEREEMEALS
ncbi:hypothetical protein LCGC14_2268070 [marine sediment metagenome]|uniref:Uncharacterized protein n=1 Tax=marine sediment metagenome TaxID=412755 RepID=A0A0F9FST4_9ZZZZ